jgi:hypothetical protein
MDVAELSWCTNVNDPDGVVVLKAVLKFSRGDVFRHALFLRVARFGRVFRLCSVKLQKILKPIVFQDRLLVPVSYSAL